ncbi:hypothetical protein [Roseibium aestuarii]|uniref:Uncharacterized protein n=1 Tax=Roseibium aestuarii TaxID=2600299 RepID=A0ABW4JYJ2_9HYPH|nr:hypothetical protein [Roseibium aestuarii]
MSKHPFHGSTLLRVSTEADLRHLIPDTLLPAVEADGLSLEVAAEACVLDRLKAGRLLRRLPLHLPPLSDAERAQRLRDQLAYWRSGCSRVIDEGLAADIVRRHRLAAA